MRSSNSSRRCTVSVAALLIVSMIHGDKDAAWGDDPPDQVPTQDSRSLGVADPESDPDFADDGGLAAEMEAYKKEMRQIADRYAPPPNARQLIEKPDLWIDTDQKRVYVDGYVTMRRGPLEMFACPVGSKEHESIVAVFAASREVHTALLAIGAQRGTTVRWDPDFLPPTGQEVTVYVTWRDSDGQFQVADARQWIQNSQTSKPMKSTWVFAGSSFWTDPSNGVEHYTADGGDMICVSNFSTAMLDVPLASSADAGQLLFTPITDRIPVENTPVRLVLVPQPIPTDDSTTPAFQQLMDAAKVLPDASMLTPSQAKSTPPAS
ncbi:MAG: YdjY domain-containing protein [Planctomycetota bacterium]